MPDFRAEEKTFSLITQVAGRAGRKESGKVIIQTYNPSTSAIKLAAEHDYEGFYKQEILNRAELNFPPFVRMAKLTIKDENDGAAHRKAEALSDFLKRQNKDEKYQITFAPGVISKLKNKYIYNIFIQGEDPNSLVEKIVDKSGITINIDPQDMF